MPMPCQEGVRAHDSSDLLEHSPPQVLRLSGQADHRACTRYPDTRLNGEPRDTSGDTWPLRVPTNREPREFWRFRSERIANGGFWPRTGQDFGRALSGRMAASGLDRCYGPTIDAQVGAVDERR